MHLREKLGLFLVALSMLCLAQATIVHPALDGRNVRHVLRRQDQKSGQVSGSGAAAPSSTPPASTPSSSLSTTTSSSSAPENTTPSSSAPSDTSASASSPPATPSPTSSSAPAPTQSVTASSKSDLSPTPTSPSNQGSPTGSSTPAASESVQVITTVIIATNSDGSIQTMTSSATPTASASLYNGGGSNQNSSMSPQTRNTVIGVVVGIGGTIVLIGLGLVAWRIWGRKTGYEESDGLMNYSTGFNAPEKSDAGGSPGSNARTPFQSTLESYHAPNQVNTASNF